MLVICSKTHIEFTASGFNVAKTTADHPLFSSSFADLTMFYEMWRKRQLTPAESRVLFCALLNSTQLVEWKSAATPAPETVAKMMYALYNMAAWKQATGSRIPLSHVSINPHTRYLENIGTWINNWNNTQREFTISSHFQSIRDKVEAVQLRLRKQMIAEKEDTETYARNLSKWFMVAGQVPAGVQELWSELITIRGLAIFSQRAADYEEILDHFREHIPMNSQYAMSCYSHISKLSELCKGGILGALSGNDSDSYEIVEDEDSIENTNVRIAASLAPLSEPREGEYHSKVAYLQARARWRLAQSESNKQLATAARVAEQEMELENNNV